MAVAGGLYDVVIACGVEKMTDTLASTTTAALASAADAIYEAEHGLSFVSLNALLMQRYMYEYGYRREDFAGFAITAHRNRRGKIGLASRLDAVPGIGPARRKALLQKFGSIEAIQQASLEELMSVKGINEEVALAIKTMLD